MIEDLIYNFAIQKNIIVGITDASPLAIKDVNSVPFSNWDAKMRLEPKLFFAEAQSIIAFGIPYENILSMQNINENYGKFALGTMGIDYHIRVRTVINEFIDYFSNYTKFNYKIHIDTEPLIEREFAKRAGLGFIGKNSMLINKRLGSYFNIGLLLVDIILAPYKDEESLDCGNCNLCESACLGNAIENYKFDYSKCVSYLTQKKGDLTEYEKSKLSKFIYGCDICQRVCKFNTDKLSTSEIRVELDKFLSLSNKEFKNEYGNTSIAWRGKKTLQRNAKIISEGSVSK